MAGRKKSKGKVLWWLDHRALVLSEAVLAVGLLQELLESWILQLGAVPPVVRIIAAVAVVVGTLGGMMILLRKRLQDWISGTHGALTSRLPLPSVLAHALIFGVLFLGYCWLWDAETGALGAIWQWMIGLGTRVMGP